MKFEKINDNKILIILSMDDLIAHNVDIGNFKSNSVQYQQLFWDIMEHAQEELDFDVSDSQLFVETSPDLNGNFIITITKSIGIKNQIEDVDKLIASKLALNNIIDNGTSFGYDFSSEEPELDSSIEESPFELVRFTNIDYLIDLCVSNPKFWSLATALYKYNNNYYISLKRNSRNGKLINKFINVAFEFNAQHVDSIILLPLIEEHGKVIISKQAIKKLAANFA